MNIITITVSNTSIGTEPYAPVELRDSIQSLLQRRIEAMELSHPRLVSCKDTHPFAQAAHDAFYDHYPLTITPDDIWFCLVQGFAQHVNLNAESLRTQFVRHQGKLKLIIEVPDFELGKPNPWPETFTAFSQQIAGHVGQALHDMVVCDFSTTTPMHRAASEVALMDMFQAYFEYEMRAGCGIPSIQLKGAPDDWRDIRNRAAKFADYGLQDWVKALLPVLDRIEASSRGHGDPEFWKSFFRYRSGSFGSAMTGWIQVLFPYLRDDHNQLVPNQYLHTWAAEYANALATQHHKDWRERDAFDGPYLQQIPSGVSSAPVKFVDLRTNKSHDLRFVAGMFGVAQDEHSLALSPSFGWAVVYDEKLPKSPPRPGMWARKIE